jgi:hypothetical protein
LLYSNEVVFAIIAAAASLRFPQLEILRLRLQRVSLKSLVKSVHREPPDHRDRYEMAFFQKLFSCHFLMRDSTTSAPAGPTSAGREDEK